MFASLSFSLGGIAAISATLFSLVYSAGLSSPYYDASGALRETEGSLAQVEYLWSKISSHSTYHALKNDFSWNVVLEHELISKDGLEALKFSQESLAASPSSQCYWHSLASPDSYCQHNDQCQNTTARDESDRHNQRYFRSHCYSRNYYSSGPYRGPWRVRRPTKLHKIPRIDC